MYHMCDFDIHGNHHDYCSLAVENNVDTVLFIAY